MRQSGGLSGFTKREESEHDCFGAGHSSTSLSAALGFAQADALNGSDAYTVAVVGDGALTGGMIHEALNNCDKKLRLIVIVNENEMSTNVILGESFRTLFGRDYIFDTVCGVKLKITAGSFYQVNHDAAELLYGLAAEKAQTGGKNGLLLDLYCGAGSIGLSMAERAEELIRNGVIEGFILHTNAVADLGYEGYDRAVAWMKAHADDEV